MEKLYQDYRHYTNSDPEAPGNIRMVNLTFFGVGGGKVPQISGEKLQKLDGAFGVNPSQLVDVAFQMFNRE